MSERKKGKMTVDEAGRMGGRKRLRPMVLNFTVK